MTTTRRPTRPHGPVDLPSLAGDHSVPASAPELAASAADSVRLLNHATVIVDVTGGPESWPGYRSPADVSDTVASLKRAVQMLPQAFAQAERWLIAAGATGLVGDDRRASFAPTAANDPALGIANACSDLRACVSVAELLAMNLGLAHAALSHLTYDLDGQEHEHGSDNRDDSNGGNDDLDGGL